MDLNSDRLIIQAPSVTSVKPLKVVSVRMALRSSISSSLTCFQRLVSRCQRSSSRYLTSYAANYIPPFHSPGACGEGHSYSADLDGRDYSRLRIPTRTLAVLQCHKIRIVWLSSNNSLESIHMGISAVHHQSWRQYPILLLSIICAVRAAQPGTVEYTLLSFLDPHDNELNSMSYYNNPLRDCTVDTRQMHQSIDILPRDNTIVGLISSHKQLEVLVACNKSADQYNLDGLVPFAPRLTSLPWVHQFLLLLPRRWMPTLFSRPSILPPIIEPAKPDGQTLSTLS